MDMIIDLFKNFVNQMGFMGQDPMALLFRLIMIVVACLLIYLAIAKGFEPYLLIPIGVGMLLVNLAPALYAAGENGEAGGLLYSFHKGIE